MAAITDYLFDTSFLKETLNYLEDEHNINVIVVDNEGQPLAETPEADTALPVSKTYSFAAPHDIGGLSCRAESQIILDSAEPHILFCLKGINSLLQRELEPIPASHAVSRPIVKILVRNNRFDT